MRRHQPSVAHVGIDGGYTSAILLLAVAALMAFQSIERLISPSRIHYDQAIAIAIVGLAVNLLCAWWLRDHHDHDHGHHHGNAHVHDGDARENHSAHDDLNLRAAYLHVVADAATSVLAIVALFGGKLWGAVWLDPVMGLVGGVLVTVWAWGLLRDSGRVLLDAEMDAPVTAEVREVIEQGAVPARLTDLHVWRIARGQYACVVSIVTTAQVDADYFRRALAVHEELVHVTVEVNLVAPRLATDTHAVHVP